MLLYGPLITQKREQPQSCRAYSQFDDVVPPDFLENWCAGGEASRDAFGEDATFDDTSAMYRETNDALLDELYAPHERRVSGQPFGFFYDMGTEGARDYPIVLDVNFNVSRIDDVFTLLQDGQYIDISTRELKFQALLLNLNSKHVTYLEYTAELRKEGSVSFDFDVHIIDTVPYGDPDDHVRIFFELLFLALLIVLSVSELTELARGGLDYFRDLGNAIDLAAFGIRFAMIDAWFKYARLCNDFDPPRYEPIYDALAVARILKPSAFINELQDTYDEIEDISDAISYFDLMLSISMVLMTMQLIKNLDFSPFLGIISRTVSGAGYDLVLFAVLLVLVIGVYGFLGSLLYGNTKDEFATLAESCFTMLLALAGMYDGSDLGTDAMTRAFFWSFMCIAYFIMLSALLAIIVNAYEGVTSSRERQRQDPVVFSVRQMWREGVFYSPPIHMEDMSRVVRSLAPQGAKGRFVKEDPEASRQKGGADAILQLLLHGLPKQERCSVEEVANDGLYAKLRDSPGPKVSRGQLLSVRLSRDMTWMVFDHHLVKLILQVAAMESGASHHGFDEKAADAFARLLLGRYGSENIDLNKDGSISEDEASALEALIDVQDFVHDPLLPAKVKLEKVFSRFNQSTAEGHTNIANVKITQVEDRARAERRATSIYYSSQAQAATRRPASNGAGPRRPNRSQSGARDYGPKNPRLDFN